MAWLTSNTTERARTRTCRSGRRRMGSSASGWPMGTASSRVSHQRPRHQRHQRERARHRGDDPLPLPQLVEERRPLPRRVEPRQLGGGGQPDEQDEQRAEQPGALHDHQPDAEARPARPMRPDDREGQDQAREHRQERARRDDRLVSRGLGPGDGAQPLAVLALGRDPATIAARPPPSHMVKPSRWRNSQKRITTWSPRGWRRRSAGARRSRSRSRASG